MILNVETFYLVREDKNMRKAKRILAFALSLVVVFSGIICYIKIKRKPMKTANLLGYK